MPSPLNESPAAERAAHVQNAARLLHSALELSTHQLAMCAKAQDAGTHRMIGEHRSLLGLTKEIAGRKEDAS